MKDKNIMYSFGFKRGSKIPKIEKNGLETNYISEITEKILVERRKKVDEEILKRMYEIYLETTDVDTLYIINESEFKKFIIKYLPIYLEELKEVK